MMTVIDNHYLPNTHGEDIITLCAAHFDDLRRWSVYHEYPENKENLDNRESG